MVAVLAPLGALLLSATILLTGNGLQTTLLPVRAGMEAFPQLAIGIMGSSYFVGFVGGCLTTAHLVRRVGHIRVFSAMVALASVVPLFHVLVVEPAAWWLLRAITGFCIAALFLVIESWLNERSDNATRGTVFSVYTTLTFVAVIMGQLLLTLDDPALFPLFAIASIVLSLATIPVALTAVTTPAPLAEVRLRPMRLLQISPAGAVGCLAVGFVNGAFWGLSPVFAADSGLDANGIAFFIGITVLGGALSQWPFGRLSDRLDRRLVILVVAAFSILIGITLYFASRFFEGAVLPLAFAFGVFSFPVYALSVAHVNDLITTEGFVEVSGGLLLVNGVGSVLGPIAAAFTMDLVGPGGLFLYIAVVYIALVGFIVLRIRGQARPAHMHSSDFMPAGDAAMPAPVAMDPRAEEQAEESDIDMRHGSVEPSEEGETENQNRPAGG